jgi:uncharacterized membrane protein
LLDSGNTSASASHSATAERLRGIQRNVWTLWGFLRSPEGQWALAWALVALAVTLDVVFVGQRALMRYHSFSADAFDLGNMDQAVWNTLHGHPFRMTNRGLDTLGPPTRLSIHVEPILLLIAPLYLIHSGPETLLVLQTVALAAGAIPLFLLGLRHLPSLPLVAATLACLYVISPEVIGSALWDFHPVALATPLLLLALWALDARHYAVFALAAFLAAMTKEDVALSLIPLGVFLIFWRGKPRLGAAVALLSIAWVGLCFGVILPHFSGGSSGGNAYWYRYAEYGATPKIAVVHLLTHPWELVTSVLGDEAKRGYLAVLLRTSGGLGLLAPGLLICALPEIAVNTLSSHMEQYSGLYQYNAMLGAYLPAAAVYGITALYTARLRVAARQSAPSSDGRAADVRPAREMDSGRVWRQLMQRFAERVSARWNGLLEHIPVPARWVGPVVVGWLLMMSAWNLAATFPLTQAFWSAGAQPARHQAQIDALLARVPAEASVAATDTLNPHLSDRYDLYLLPDPQSYQAEYVAFDIRHAVSFSQADDQRIYDTMLASGHYQVVGQVGTVVLLRRTGPPLSPSPGSP